MTNAVVQPVKLLKPMLDVATQEWIILAMAILSIVFGALNAMLVMKVPVKRVGADGQEIDDENENIMKALLSHMEDSLALEFMGIYCKYLKEDLFLHSLKMNNKEFI